MHPRFVELAQAARDAGLQLGLYTNGTNHFKRADLFKWIFVSLDECRSEDYREVKGRDWFYRVTDNIRMWVREPGHTGELGIGYLLHERNRALVGPMMRTAETLCADYVHFRPVVGLDSYAWVSHTVPLLRALQSDVLTVSVSYDRFARLADRTPRGYSQCRGSELVPCIGADGTVWVCPNTRGLRPLGSLKEQTFGEIWQARRPQLVGGDCRVECRNDALNRTLSYICGQEGPHDEFV